MFGFRLAKAKARLSGHATALPSRTKRTRNLGDHSDSAGSTTDGMAALWRVSRSGVPGAGVGFGTAAEAEARVDPLLAPF
jgi:hypothetical protein